MGFAKVILLLLEVKLFLLLLVYVDGQSQCTLQNGKCTYNINLSPVESCHPSSAAGPAELRQEIPSDSSKQRDDAKMYQMERDLNVVKADHENRIKELEHSIQSVLRNSIPTGPVDYSVRSSNVVDKRPNDYKRISREEEGFHGSGDTLLMQLQSQFNRLRSSLSKRTADLLETRNKLNETSDLLKETQKQLFKTSSQLEVFETKAAILEKEANIAKNKLKHKTEKLEYTEERLNQSETKLLNLETQLYDVVRAEATLREEYETVKLKLNRTETELGELRDNHTALIKRHHRTKKTLHLREEELMECYTGKMFLDY